MIRGIFLIANIYPSARSRSGPVMYEYTMIEASYCNTHVPYYQLAASMFSFKLFGFLPRVLSPFEVHSLSLRELNTTSFFGLSCAKTTFPSLCLESIEHYSVLSPSTLLSCQFRVHRTPSESSGRWYLQTPTPQFGNRGKVGKPRVQADRRRQECANIKKTCRPTAVEICQPQFVQCLSLSRVKGWPARGQVSLSMFLLLLFPPAIFRFHEVVGVHQSRRM